jgi:hypothetical protein
VIFDEILSRYPSAFDEETRYRPPTPCDHHRDFGALHDHIDAAAALQHRHLLHLEGTIMAAIDDLRAEVEASASAIDNVAIPALDALMAAVQNGSASEAELGELVTSLQASNARLRDKANEAAALVGGEG